MPPLGRPVAAVRGSRIFGGFLRFLTRYWKEPSDLSRAAKHGLLFADHGWPVTVAGSRGADHGCRIIAGDLRAGMFGEWIAGHGAACPLL